MRGAVGLDTRGRKKPKSKGSKASNRPKQLRESENSGRHLLAHKDMLSTVPRDRAGSL